MNKIYASWLILYAQKREYGYKPIVDAGASHSTETAKHVCYICNIYLREVNIIYRSKGHLEWRIHASTLWACSLNDLA